MSKPFSFRRFTVQQEKAAFKVGTDSVLLGSWADVQGAGTILDIGTGTGLLALMMAQRSDASIQAVEPDLLSFDQARSNFLNSPWPDRIRIHLSSIEDFAKKKPGKFDVIISNPPYFHNQLKSPDPRKTSARHTQSLSFRDLANAVNALLSDTGKFFVILPCESFNLLQSCLEQQNIFAGKISEVSSFEDSDAIRIMGGFSRIKRTLQHSPIYLYDRATGHRSSQVNEMTKDFYL